MKVGVCIRIKDEGSLINEFIAHYKLLGFDKIFIYDNESAIDVREQIRPSLLSFVDIQYDNNQPLLFQRGCYNDCMKKHREYDWILICDVDEFLDIRQGINIKDYLIKAPEDVSCVLINWLTYGTGNQMKRDYSKLVMEQFTVREDYNFWWNKFVKSFVRPDAVRACGVHITRNLLNGKISDSGFNTIDQIRLKNCSYDDPELNGDTPLVMVHYSTMDYETLSKKNAKNVTGGLLKKGDNKYTDEWYKKYYKDNNVDTRMRDVYASGIKKLLDR